MNVPCEDCGNRPGQLRGVATWICALCNLNRTRLDDCPADGIRRPTPDELEYAERRLLSKALPFNP